VLNKKWTAKVVYEFESSLAEKSKREPKLVYNYVRSKQRAKAAIRSLRDSTTGVVHSDTGEIVRILRQQFDSAFSAVDDSDNVPVDETTSASCDVPDVLNLINPTTVLGKLRALQIGKSVGWDGVCPQVLKRCADGLALPITMLFRLSLSSAAVPEAWKRANVTAIYKKGSKLDAGNFRPVSLTSTLCKELEKFIKSAIMNHLESNNLLSPSQHGFVKKKGCVTNLLESMDNITLAMARGLGVLVILLDFAKAFDKVSHFKLRLKLQAIGIRGKLLDWITYFLRQRKQRVVMGQNTSEWSDVKSGVPQGSVLGPILFIIFINDMPENLRSKILLYADDSKLISTIGGPEDIESTHADIDKLVAWSDKWLMELNLDKCKVMKFGNAPEFTHIITDKLGVGHVLLETQEEKDLGVLITTDLKSKFHCQAAASTGNRVLGALLHSFVSRDVDLWRKLYLSLVRPHLEYASTVWNPSTLADTLKIESVQRRATKRIRSFRKLGYTARLARLDLTTLEIRRQRVDLIQVYKTINNLETVTLCKLLVFTESNRALRGHKLKLSFDNFSSVDRNNFASCIARRENFLYSRVVALWNQLPETVATARSLNAFKARLDEYLSTNPGGHLKELLRDHIS
jgi:hypothetical protein